LLDECRKKLYEVQQNILLEVGLERLQRAGELGVLRLMLKHSDFFFKLLEIPEVLAVVDATVSPSATLHLQNGFILPSFSEGNVPSVFQNKFHMDFPRVMNGYLASINTFFAIDDFTINNGGTLIALATHQCDTVPSKEYLEMTSKSIECPAGSMLVFDSTLWHAAGFNVSGKDRLAINQQFTRSFFKQQIDYVRALGSEVVQAQLPRTQQLLGWYTRVVTSLDEYYQPADKRLYRAGQG
jgi:ectoine hydroxylase-related dioxygenase (phytanoyl-CoA dioxygenase family)